MAASLPTHRTTFGGADYGPYTSKRGVRLKERYFIALVFIVFFSVCITTFYYLPEMGGDVLLDRAGRNLIFPIPDEARQPKRFKYISDLKPNASRAGPGGVDDKGSLDRMKESLKEQPPKKPDEAGFKVSDKDKESAPTDAEVVKKREKVKEMMQHAWSNYVRFAWGQNELRPISRRGHSASIFGATSMGATIVDAMDTLLLMGLRTEFDQAREWVSSSLSFDSATEVSLFEFNIRFVGGLLSAYAFTKDEMFKKKTVELVERLLPAFNTPTGIPNAMVNLATGSSRNWGWASGGCSILAEFGTIHMEFAYLSEVTGDPKYLQKVQRIREVLRQVEKPQGLYPNYLNPGTGKWCQHHSSIGALGDSFYEYLLKEYLRSGARDREALDLFEAAMDSMLSVMLKKSEGGLSYIGDYRGGRVDPKMDHLGCFSGGLLALASTRLLPGKEEKAKKYLETGKDITHTCHESYIRAATHIGPEAFHFEQRDSEAKAIRQNEKYYILRPEVVESYFVLWRVTRDPKYREWGWDAVQALEKYCRVENGYSGIRDVYLEAASHDDVQQSFFLAETLKYLFLLFSDDSALPFDQWVLNTEAHPLPVRTK